VEAVFSSRCGQSWARTLDVILNEKDRVATELESMVKLPRAMRCYC
jgi:hypothetical protein